MGYLDSIEGDMEGYSEEKYQKRVLLDDDASDSYDDGDLEIEPGMRLMHKDYEGSELVIDWTDTHRDRENVVVYDDCGHSEMINIFDGNYYLLHTTNFKFRVLYGSSRCSEDLKVSEKWYPELSHFREDTMHEGFAKLLGCTGKHFKIGENKLGKDN